MKRTLYTLGLLLLCHSFSSAQITPQEAIEKMQKGINLGNTLEPPNEGGWNNPPAEEYYFDLYKEAGFEVVRVPVRWDEHTGTKAPYQISSSWLNRVEQIVDWGLERDLFIVLNAHHEEWIKSDYSEANKARFDSIWTQIAERFKNKPEKLIFEIINEPYGLTRSQNDDLHARILSIIRKTNPTRLVIFQGHNWGGSDELIVANIPDDDYLIGSFHSYDPWPFGLEGTGTFGGSADYRELENKFITIDNWSEENKIPVFLGEFGSVKSADYNSRMRQYRAYVELSQKYGFSSAAWDDGGDFRIMERQKHDWDEVKDILIHTTWEAPDPRVDVYQDSIVRVRWENRTANNDSIIIQRRMGTELHYTTIATLKPDTTSYFDVKPAMTKYYSYRVIAHYNDSTDLYSQPFRTFFPSWIKPVREYFNDTLMTVPGVIEAEDFDKGGEGLSYHDADEKNVPGKYRPNEGVDIYDRLGKGYHIGNILEGEWYEYSVNVTTEGWYNITANIASYYSGGKFQIQVDTVESEIMTVKSSQSALNTMPFTTKMYLYPGEQIVRFTIISTPSFNIDNFSFDLATGNEESVYATKAPFFAWQNNYRELIIKQNHGHQVERMDIYTITGQLVHSVSQPQTETHIPEYKLHQGIYLIQTMEKGKKYSQKIVIR